MMGVVAQKWHTAFGVGVPIGPRGIHSYREWRGLLDREPASLGLRARGKCVRPWGHLEFNRADDVSFPDSRYPRILK